MHRLPRLVASASRTQLRPRLTTVIQHPCRALLSHQFSTSSPRRDDDNEDIPGLQSNAWLQLPPEARAQILKDAEALEEYQGLEEDEDEDGLRSMDDGQWEHQPDNVEYPPGLERTGRFHYQLPFPDLSEPDPIYDLKEQHEYPPTPGNPFHNRIVIRNDPSMFAEAERLRPDEWDEGMDEDEKREEIRRREAEAAAIAEGKDPRKGRAKDKNAREEDDEAEEEESNPRRFLPLNGQDRARLHLYPLIRRRVVQQTGLGKMPRIAILVVVGNANGLVGMGEGKHINFPQAMNRAYCEAIRNMDYVERFEDRTIWTEMESKLGSTKIILRPRPIGFGLHCNPYIHQIAKAAGIKDISAKVWGSRNPINVIKLMFRMLQAGNAPVAMGNGVGGGARKLDKGTGVRGKKEVERERGRRLFDLRTY